MEETVLRSEVLRQMNSGIAFNLEFVKADRRRGTGGQLVKVSGWQKVLAPLPEKAEAPTARKAHHARGVYRPGKTILIYNPQHRGGHPTPVHLRLMQFFNGKRITNG